MTDQSGRVHPVPMPPAIPPAPGSRTSGGQVQPQYDEATVVLVRAVMDYIDGECVGRDTQEHEEGCDACAFDALLQALPSALQRAAIRYKPKTAPARNDR